MQEVSTKEASRRFYRLLKDAEDGPVLITRHGRRRAAILSANDYEIFQRVLAFHREGAALHCLEAAIEKVAEGRFTAALRLRKAGLIIGGLLK